MFERADARGLAVLPRDRDARERRVLPAITASTSGPSGTSIPTPRSARPAPTCGACTVPRADRPHAVRPSAPGASGERSHGRAASARARRSAHRVFEALRVAVERTAGDQHVGSGRGRTGDRRRTDAAVDFEVDCRPCGRQRRSSAGSRRSSVPSSGCRPGRRSRGSPSSRAPDRRGRARGRSPRPASPDSAPPRRSRRGR